MNCSDCHNNNAGPNTGGAGPNGPHGSTNPRLLERANPTALTTEGPNAYPLCFKCHSYTSIMSNASFPFHNYHLKDMRIPCAACHDPHGISGTQGNALNNGRLMNFATSLVGISPLVTPTSGGGAIRWEQTSPGHGKCYLDCHVNGVIVHNGSTKTY